MICHHHRVWQIYEKKKHSQLIKYIYFFSKFLKMVIVFFQNFLQWGKPTSFYLCLYSGRLCTIFTIFFKLKKRCDFLLPGQFHSRISMAHWERFMVEGHTPTDKVFNLSSRATSKLIPQGLLRREKLEERGPRSHSQLNRETHFYRFCSLSLRYEIPLELRVLRSSSVWKQLSKGTHVGL